MPRGEATQGLDRAGWWFRVLWGPVPQYLPSWDLGPALTDILWCFLGSNEFSRLVAGEYLSFFDFSGLTLDRALRSVGLGWDSAHRGWNSTPGLSFQVYHDLLRNLYPSGRAVGRETVGSSCPTPQWTPATVMNAQDMEVGV